jgi:tRNA pseudouridine55 synthase
MSTLDGYILIDKPAGWTSFDVVAKVRGLVKAANQQAQRAGRIPADQTLPKRVKVGHTGTLDPLATGLLVVLVGKYTKQAPSLTKLDKTYEVTMKLGETSTTGDGEGDKLPGGSAQPTLADVQHVLQAFVGDIQQIPPAFSAIKVNGQRAYKLARAGQTVQLEARPVRINSIELSSYEYPLVRFTASVSSGTYIRSLVEDVGEALGTGAYMSALRRTAVGPFSLEAAQPITALNAENIASLIVQS